MAPAAVDHPDGGFEGVRGVVVHAGAALGGKELLNEDLHTRSVFFVLVEDDEVLFEKWLHGLDAGEFVGFFAGVLFDGDDVAASLALFADFLEEEFLKHVGLHIVIDRHTTVDKLFDGVEPLDHVGDGGLVGKGFEEVVMAGLGLAEEHGGLVVGLFGGFPGGVGIADELEILRESREHFAEDDILGLEDSA